MTRVREALGSVGTVVLVALAVGVAAGTLRLILEDAAERDRDVHGLHLETVDGVRCIVLPPHALDCEWAP